MVSQQNQTKMPTARVSLVERALCFKQKRTVAKDNTVTFEGTVLQIPKTSPYRSYANKRIDVICCSMAPWSFSTKPRKSQPSFKNNAHNWLISNERQEGGVPLWSPF
jgi:hypothetical protein